MTIIREGFFEGARTKDLLIGWSIIGIPLLILVTLGIFFLKPESMPRELVLGCYVANGAPSLEVGLGSIIIGESERRKFDYSVEPYKQGYHFLVSPALSLRPDGAGKYSFVHNERGIGYFWSLLPAHSDDPQSVRKALDFGGRFQIIAYDGNAIIYSRTVVRDKCN